MNIRKILVVCTGNICRSPMAEAILASRIQNQNIEVSSAGVAALVGRPADDCAIRVMDAHGYNIKGHVARQASISILKEADLILVMEREHRHQLMRLYPQLTGRVYKMGHWSNDADVDDPYRQGMTMFETCYTEVLNYSEQWIDRISR